MFGVLVVLNMIELIKTQQLLHWQAEFKSPDFAISTRDTFFLPQTIPWEHLILDCLLVCLCPFTWPSHSPIFDPPHSHTGSPYTKERTKTCIWLFVCMATNQISHSSNLTLWVNLALFTTPMTAGKYVGLSAWQLTHVVAETCIS